MPSPVSVYMYVQPGTIIPTPPKGRLSQDPARPTPNLISVTVVDNATTDSGTYSTSAHTAICQITATEWANMCTMLGNSSYQTRVDITYDNSASGTTKPLIGGPVFSLV